MSIKIQYVVATVLVFCGVWFLLNTPGLSFLGTVFCLIFISGGAVFWVRARRLSVIKKRGEVTTDDRPIVLLLRPFSVDESVIRDGLLLEITSQEEELAKAVEPIGNLVAIGEPDQTLPDIGADRLYSGPNGWKKTIEDLISKSRLIIIRAGKGGGIGLNWELETLVRRARPENVVILVWMWRPAYEVFAKTANQAVSWKLPEYEKIGTAGRIHGFIEFDNKWNTNFIPGSMPFFRRSMIYRYKWPFYYGLKPAFERMGVPWKKPSLNPILIISIFLLLIGALLMLSEL